MASAIPRGPLALLGSLVAIYVLITPFTKVEESFNVQAIHDVLYHGLDVQAYDHLEFPGVVPRTFLGAIALALPLLPLRLLASALGLPKIWMLVAARLALGAASVGALAALASAVAGALGADVAGWLLLLTASQFHLPFYMSRPLPNTLASVLTTLGLAEWVAGRRPRAALALLAFTAVVFRCDVVMLAGLVGLQLLADRKVGFGGGVAAGAAGAAAGLAATVAADSWLWRRPLWPEGEVLWFNTVLNKSHEWGVAPPGWYFLSALPRALHAAYPLAAAGAALDPRVRRFFLVGLGFVALYSHLGHKELRFLLPALPLWNLAAAAGAAALARRRGTGLGWRLAWTAFLAALAAGVATAGLGLAASAANYPGGVALRRVHVLGAQHAQQALADGRNLTVHIGVLPAMTGVSRFGEGPSPWVYSKAEGLSEAALKKARFDYLLSDKAAVKGYTAVEGIEGFAGLRWAGGSPAAAAAGVLRGRLPLVVATAPAVYIHKSN